MTLLYGWQDAGAWLLLFGVVYLVVALIVDARIERRQREFDRIIKEFDRKISDASRRHRLS